MIGRCSKANLRVSPRCARRWGSVVTNLSLAGTRRSAEFAGMLMQRTIASVVSSIVLIALASCATPAPEAPAAPHNVVIFVADGMRYGSVDQTNAPELFAAKQEGVDFANSHSIYPTLTTVNASAI